MPGQTKSTVQSKPSAAKEALALKTLEELMEVCALGIQHGYV